MIIYLDSDFCCHLANDGVSHNGKRWESNMGANVYEPGAFGWDELP